VARVLQGAQAHAQVGDALGWLGLVGEQGRLRQACRRRSPECYGGPPSAADDGRAASTYERLKGVGYVLSKCHITSLYLVQDRGTGDESNFLQVEIEDEWSDRALFANWPFQQP